VIVVTWNATEMAATTVARALERSGTLDIEVIVVDNASPDGTADILRAVFAAEPRVEIVDAGGNLGFARANNLALDRARGRHVVFLNPDTEVGPGTLETCVSELDADPRVGVVGCRLVYPDGRIQFEGARRAYRVRHLLWEALYLHALFPRSPMFAHQLMGDDDHLGVGDVEAVSGAFLMTPRRVALQLGGLPDDLFMYHEDLAYCIRARGAGLRVVYRGDVETVHHGAASSSRNPAPLELLEGEVRVRLIRDRSGSAWGLVGRAAFGLRQCCRALLAVPVALVPAARRRFPQVASVGKQLRLLIWTVWPGAAWGPLARAGVPVDGRPGLLVVGPTPPPVHGVSAYVAMLVAFLPLRARFRVRHVDTSDRRGIETIGRVDPTNVVLGLRHLAALVGALWSHRPTLTLIPVSQNGPAFLRDALFVAAARGAGSRVVLHLHGGAFAAFHRDAPRWLRWVIRWTHGRVEAVWVLGGGLLGQVAGLVPAERLFVVPNGVPDPWAGGAPPDHPGQNRGDPLRVLLLGQISVTKGLDGVLDAARLLSRRGVVFRLVVAGAWGSPADRSRLEPELAAMESAGLVERHGVVTGETKVRLFAGADVFVLNSTAPEGMPLTVLEAMAAGLPVVATPQGAVADAVVDGGTGFLVPPQDPTALADALERLAADPTLRRGLGAVGRARYLERFTARQALDGAVAALRSLD
jgi:GT2 family glycosyltransferase/glycosyltransferase involved in cell wall biosynthesis